MARTGAFAFAGVLALSVTACDDERTQPSEEEPMSEAPQNDDDS